MTARKKTAQAKVKKAIHERKEGTLRSGKSGKKVTSKKQAIAIGLSEARKAGAKVPKKKNQTERTSHGGVTRSLRYSRNENHAGESSRGQFTARTAAPLPKAEVPHPLPRKPGNCYARTYADTPLRTRRTLIRAEVAWASPVASSETRGIFLKSG
jgi:hypothetical protein